MPLLACGDTRKSHKDNEDAVVVANSGDTVDGFQSILVIVVSISDAIE